MEDAAIGGVGRARAVVSSSVQHMVRQSCRGGEGNEARTQSKTWRAAFKLLLENSPERSTNQTFTRLCGALTIVVSGFVFQSVLARWLLTEVTGTQMPPHKA